MPNTPTPDLDRDALKRACEAYHGAVTVRDGIRAAIKAYLAGLPHASGAEPVAWIEPVTLYELRNCKEWALGAVACTEADGFTMPLYTAPTPPSASSGDGELLHEPIREQYRGRLKSGTTWSKWEDCPMSSWFCGPEWIVEKRWLYALGAPAGSPIGGGELSLAEEVKTIEQACAVIAVRFLTHTASISLVRTLHKSGFRIVRTALSGEQG